VDEEVEVLQGLGEKMVQQQPQGLECQAQLMDQGEGSQEQAETSWHGGGGQEEEVQGLGLWVGHDTWLCPYAHSERHWRPPQHHKHKQTDPWTGHHQEKSGNPCAAWCSGARCPGMSWCRHSTGPPPWHSQVHPKRSDWELLGNPKEDFKKKSGGIGARNRASVG